MPDSLLPTLSHWIDTCVPNYTCEFTVILLWYKAETICMSLSMIIILLLLIMATIT